VTGLVDTVVPGRLSALVEQFADVPVVDLLDEVRDALGYIARR